MTRRTLVVAAAMAAAAGCAADPNYGSLDASPARHRDAGPSTAAPTTRRRRPAGVVAAGVRWFGRVDTTRTPRTRASPGRALASSRASRARR